MDNYKGNYQISIPHKKFINFLFITEILLSLEDLSEVNLIDSGLSHKLFFPPA
jgi:hypothetical protein